MDLKLLLGGALLTGVGVVAYVFLKETTPTTPTPAPAPINPSLPAPPVAQMPAAPASSDVVMACAQVVTECADGSWAPTPCDCRDRGGVAPAPTDFLTGLTDFLTDLTGLFAGQSQVIKDYWT